jgi:hypothetical protein
MKLFLILFLLFAQAVFAEYRAFQLQITKQTEKGPEVLKTFISTLDPDQYKDFYLLNEGEQITYIDTWMCFGRTDQHTPTCPSPRSTSNQQETEK